MNQKASKVFMIVDGYNVLNDWPVLSGMVVSDLEHARDRLVALLSDYQGYTGQEVIVVFDAYQVQGSGVRRERNGNLEVIFSGFGETADTVIERLVGKLAALGEVIVATSDRDEQQMVWFRGARRISAREFRAEVEKTRELGSYHTPSSKTSWLDEHMDEGTRNKLEQLRRQGKGIRTGKDLDL